MATLLAMLLLALLGQASGDLKQAAMRGRLDLIAEELDAGSDINARGTGSPDGTALLAAVLAAKAESVRELLARGADPELPNRDGMTPLHAAAFQNQRDVIEALIEGGATVEKFGPDGYSLLHRATWRPGEAAVDALLYLLEFLDVDTRAVAAVPEKKRKKKGQGRRQAAAVGGTALMEAAARGQVYAVRALLDHGADVAAVDQAGRGVLHHAVSSSGSDEIVQILLAAEAPLALKDAQGQTATARAAQLSGGSMSTGGKMLTGREKFPSLFRGPPPKGLEREL